MSKVTVKGVAYDVPDSLTLGETRDVVKAFGNLEPGDKIGMFIGTVYLAMRERDPSVTPEYVLDLDWKDIEIDKDVPVTEDDAVPPAQAAPQDEPTGVAV